MPAVVVKVTESANPQTTTIEVPVARITKNDTAIRWTLAAPNWNWANESDSIKIATQASGPYNGWGLSQPQFNSTGKTYTVTGVNESAMRLFKYTIRLVRNDGAVLVIDPDIANDPPGSDDPGEHGRR